MHVLYQQDKPSRDFWERCFYFSLVFYIFGAFLIREFFHSGALVGITHLY